MAGGPWLIRSLWTGVALLVAIGVVAGIARSVFVEDLSTRVEPLRTRLLAAGGRDDPFASTRAAELALVDGRFARHRIVTLLHVLPGALFLLMAPFQFSSRVRQRYIGFHRWSGRLLVATAVITGVPGLFFGIFIPFAGVGEASAIAVFGGLFLTAIVKGFLAIRGGDATRHRAWMIRAFAVALGISTVRIVVVALDYALTPAGFSPRSVFVLSIWIGLGATVAAAELWLMRTEGNRSPAFVLARMPRRP